MPKCLLLTAATLLAACGGLPLNPDASTPGDGGLVVDGGGPDDGGAAEPREPDASVPPDGGAPGDGGAPSDGGTPVLEVEDWRTTRGAPLAITVPGVGEFPGGAWALGEDAFALESCPGDTCDYSWHDATGARTATRTGLRAVHSSAHSRDGRQAALLQVSSSGFCSDAWGLRYETLAGDFSLLDATTGELLRQAPAVMTPLHGDAFLAFGRYARPHTMSGCELRGAPVFSTRPPYLEPKVPDTAWVEDELPGGALVVTWAPETLAVVDPAAPGRVERVSDEATSVRISGRFVHAFSRAFVRRLTSWDSEAHRRTVVDLPWTQADLQEGPVSHRYASVCGAASVAGAWPCTIFDGQGERPPRTLLTGGQLGRPALALAGRSDFAVYLTPSGRLARLDLASGQATTLDMPLGRPRAVGDGRAVLVVTGDAAFGVERERAWRFDGALVAVMANELAGGRAELPQSQVVWLATTHTPGGNTTLTAWHVAQGRVVRLTDRLRYVLPFNAPYTAAADCSAPGSLRVSGPPSASRDEAATRLHFTEETGGSTVRVFVLPVDLSSPPRLFLEVDRAHCAPPLASPSGSRLWLPVRTVNGQTAAVLGAW